MYDSYYVALCVFMGFLATYGSRILPLLLFKKASRKNETLAFIQKNMPLMIMVILVFYTLFNYDLSNFKILCNIIFSSFLALLLQVIFKNSLLSIFTSVASFMLISHFL